MVTVQCGPRPRNVATSRQEMVTKVSSHGPLATRVPAHVHSAGGDVTKLSEEFHRKVTMKCLKPLC